MTPLQRRATTWLTPLPFAALPWLIVLDHGEVPSWLQIVAAAPGFPFFIPAMFGPGNNDTLFIAGFVTSSTVWYALGSFLVAVALRRFAKQPLPSRTESATALFLFLIGVIGVTILLSTP